MKYLNDLIDSNDLNFISGGNSSESTNDDNSDNKSQHVVIVFDDYSPYPYGYVDPKGGSNGHGAMFWL